MKKLIALSLALVPGVTFAAQLTDINSVTGTFSRIATTAIEIIITIAVIWIIINVVRYLIIGGDDPDKRKTAGAAILYGIIGLFVILSIWGLVAILRNTFSTQNNAPTTDFPKVIPPSNI